ncbi:MAG: PorP/SprF family type IX secretion system membrane protein [Bacteroidota bacterium]
MKVFRVLCLLALVCFLGNTKGGAQDIHFSQFYLSPLNLNPAMTGVMSCQHRFVVNYRNQYASVLKSNAFNTYSVSYDNRIPVGRYDNFGWGFSLWGDVAGQSSFQTLEARGSFAYSKRMSGYRKRSSYLSAGADFGLAQRSIDFLALQYGTQNNDGNFDPSLPSFENFDVSNFMFFDMSAGMLWYTVLNETDNFYIGGVLSHLTRANQAFNRSGDDQEFEALYTKITLHAGGEFALTDRLGIVPGIVSFIQGPSMQINGGTSFKFRLGQGRNTYQAFHLGTWVRVSNTFTGGIHTDALILQTRFDYNNFSLGLSYDVNVSSLRPASNSNGAYELSLVYKICQPERRGVFCPDF